MKEVSIAVIGLGAVGSAVLNFVAGRGKSVLGIDRFDPPHGMGSSHGETRISRLAVGEGKEYVTFAKRSQEIWKELEKKSGKRLFEQVGGILIDSADSPWRKYGGSSFFDQTRDIAQAYGIAHELIDQKEGMERFSSFQVGAGARFYRESSAGYVFPEEVIRVHMALAEEQGASIRVYQPVRSIQQKGDWVELGLRDERIRARQVVLSAGGWNGDFLEKSERDQFQICRQVLHWAELEAGSPMASQKEVFMWGFGPDPSDFLYGFPSLDGQTIKLASEQFSSTAHPELLNRTVTEQEKAKFFDEKIKGKILGLKPRILRSEVCFYTVTADAKFVLKPHPRMDRVMLVSACSGHGFKHASALGEALAETVLGRL